MGKRGECGGRRASGADGRGGVGIWWCSWRGAGGECGIGRWEAGAEREADDERDEGAVRGGWEGCLEGDGEAEGAVGIEVGWAAQGMRALCIVWLCCGCVQCSYLAMNRH